MGRAIAFMMGVLLGSHGFLGLFVEGEHLLGLFNVDILLDIVYLFCALVLLVVGGTRSPAGLLRGGLLFVAAVFLLIAVLGLLDDSLAGLLPTTLTKVDIGFLFVVGGIAAVTALLPRVSEPLQTGGVALN
ncbi:hypothetical protein [Planctomonas deserti]|jgi:hypothetical protein|uniref:hypothetical protein n=1 Tax=Planctomonas deserti TaxID=2144185 RepID=UPI000D38D411|nr:hypothetical protein [Planctomonas deserti]